MASAPGLSLPTATLARLTPIPFLAAHLRQPNAVRPNGRIPNEFRHPTFNTGSLSHTNGSAVVRLGDTAVVCGIRGEILLAADIPHFPLDSEERNGLIEDLGLLVPNVELSTGCSPAHLPGNPPSTLAQALSYRVSSLLYDSHLISPADLSIDYTEPKIDDDTPEEGPKVVTKAYWTLYVDILCMALDGNAFDAAWLAVVAALQNTTLPHAWWDEDREMIVCSPLAKQSRSLHIKAAHVPVASTFAVFTTASPLKQRSDAENWLLADPDANEEEACNEVVTIVSIPASQGRKGGFRIEKGGGPFVDINVTRQCVQAAEQRRVAVSDGLRGG